MSRNTPEAKFCAAIDKALGYAPDPEDIRRGRLMSFPLGRRADGRRDTGWFRMLSDGSGGAYGDFGRGIHCSWVADDDASGEGRRRAAAAAVRAAGMVRTMCTNMDNRIAVLLGECEAIAPGSPARRHLCEHGVPDVWPLPECLRAHPWLPHMREGKSPCHFPVLAAPLVAPDDGRRIGLYLVPLRSRCGNGQDIPERTSASGPVAGACVQLGQPTTSGVLGVAVKIETALAAWYASGVPTVAACSPLGLAAWRWPAGLRRLAIFIGNDLAEREAAAELHKRAAAAGVRCEVLMLAEQGADWRNVWAGRDPDSIGEAAGTSEAR